MLFVLIVFMTGIGIGNGKFMTNMRGPGPDWNAQNAAFRAVAGKAGQIPGLNFTNFGEKGKTFIWGSSFDEGTGLQEIYPGFSGGSSSVSINTAHSNTGGASVKLFADSGIGNWAGFSRYGNYGGVISKIGSMVSVNPETPTTGSNITDFTMGIYINYWGIGRDFGFSGLVKISRQAGGVRKLFVFNQTLAYVDSGLSIDEFFYAPGELSFPWYPWHTLKLVVNPTLDPPMYDYFEIDGHHFDLSGFQCPSYTAGSPFYSNKNTSRFDFLLTNQEAVAKTVYVDDVLISANEGGLVSSLAGGGGGGGVVGYTQGARVYHDAAQATVSGTPLILALNSERFDTDTIHDPVTNNSRLTCKTAGIYMIGANIEFSTVAVSFQGSLYILLNGATIISEQVLRKAAAAGVLQININCIYALAVNNYVEAVVLQDSGAGMNINASGNYSPEFWMQRIG